MRCKLLLSLTAMLFGCEATAPATGAGGQLSPAGPVFVWSAPPASNAASAADPTWPPLVEFVPVPDAPAPDGPATDAPAPDADAAPAAMHDPASPASDAASAASAASQSPPAQFERNGYALHWRQPSPRVHGDDVDVLHEGSGVRVLISSRTGAGQVELRPEHGVWPYEVQVQFQYAPGRPFKTLEGLRFQVINPAHLAGDELPPPVPDGFVVWQREGRLAVSLPGGWLTGRQGLIVTWVDRHRN